MNSSSNQITSGSEDTWTTWSIVIKNFLKYVYIYEFITSIGWSTEYSLETMGRARNLNISVESCVRTGLERYGL